MLIFNVVVLFYSYSAITTLVSGGSLNKRFSSSDESAEEKSDNYYSRKLSQTLNLFSNYHVFFRPGSEIGKMYKKSNNY